MTNCLFCRSTNIKDSCFPNTQFNGKQFAYKRCSQCRLIFVDPIPNSDDLMAMYPVSYQQKVECGIVKPSEKLAGLRFSYNEHFKLIHSYTSKGSVMCDFGCGNGNFVFNMLHHQRIQMDGVEFNPDFVKLLKSAASQLNFYTVDDFLVDAKKYDLIRLSNVFEHFTDPVDMTKQISHKLKPGGFLLIEGPLENNTSLALLYKKLYFIIKKALLPNCISHHAPTHTVYTNRQNQRQMLKMAGFKHIHYHVHEFPWPFPEYLHQVKSVKQALMFIFGKASVMISALIPGWGNTFLYLGKKHESIP